MAWAPDYIDVADLTDYTRVEDHLDDVEVAGAIAAASRAIDDATGRQFGKVDAPEARVYPPYWDALLCQWMAPIDDLATVTGSLLDAVVLSPADLYPRNAASKGKVWTRLRVDSCEEVTVTASWGWPAVPDTIVTACKLQADRFLNRRDSPYGVAGSPQTGSELRLLAKVDPDVAVMLRGYVRLRGAR